MMQKNLTHAMISLAVVIYLCIPFCAFANESNGAAQIYRLGETVNAGHDKGYAESSALAEDDPHFGWSLGSFFVAGYTSVSRGDGSSPTFLKTNDDEVVLYFRLEQNIDCLNGNRDLSISEDKNGYDEAFGIEKTDFGRGSLIVRKTDHNNVTEEPQLYTNYLSAITQGADTKVELCEEGDYEVTLDYEVKNSPRHLPLVGWEVVPTYTDYKIKFSFSVRNGNTMVFPFDAKTGEELTNTSVTSNGFYIDLAQSHYLDVNVKRSVMVKGKDGYAEDVRSNAPAEDKKKYTDEGIYTITVSNPTTGQVTEKTIYVGDDAVLKAFVSNSYTTSQIENMIAQGATVDENGTIIFPNESKTSASIQAGAGQEDSKSSGLPTWIVVVVVVVAIVVAVAGFLLARKKRKPTSRVADASKSTTQTHTVDNAEPETREDSES